MTTDRVLLVGMMGAGKTAVGRSLAELLGWPYLDNDDEVTRVAGAAPAEIERTRGLDALHDAETRALERACARPGPLVAGVAGGAVLREANRRILRGCGAVVWLRARTATLVRRVATDPPRPILGDDPAGVLERLAAEREPFYAAVAGTVVDVDDLTPAQAAARIADVLSLRRAP